MASLNIGNAAFAGFRVIGRNPVAVLVWGLLLLVLSVLPVGAMMISMIGAVTELAKLPPEQVEANPEATIGPAMTSIMMLQPISLITGLVWRALVGAAVFRAVLEPEQSRWFYLRLGVQELWLGLVMVVFGFLLFIGMFMVWLLLIPLVIFAAMTPPESQGVALALLVPVVLAGLGAILWLLLRFSMALPMTFAERNFRLFESWTMTRGRVTGLLGIAVLIFVILLLAEMVLVGIGVAGFLGLGASGHLPHGLLETEDPVVLLHMLWPWLVAAGVIGSLLGAALTAILAAPWAEAYRQLAAKPEPAAA